MDADAFEAVSQIASGIGVVEGRVLKDGEDVGDAVIIHEQEVTEVFMGSDIEIKARVIDDVLIKKNRAISTATRKILLVPSTNE